MNPRTPTIMVAVAALVIIAFFISMVYFPSSSDLRAQGNAMFPTIKGDQDIIIYEGHYERFPVQRGDVVTIKLKTLEEVLIRRVIAIPGDSLEFSEGRIILNEETLSEPYLNDPGYLLTEEELRLVRIPLDRFGAVPEGSYFVLNDNRQVRGDSRDYGFIPLEYITGKVII